MDYVNIFQIVAGISEFTGAIFLANKFFPVKGLGFTLWALFSSLWNGNAAKELEEGVDCIYEKPLTTFKGIALIGLGFMIQTICSVSMFFLRP